MTLDNYKEAFKLACLEVARQKWCMPSSDCSKCPKARQEECFGEIASAIWCEVFSEEKKYDR